MTPMSSLPGAGDSFKPVVTKPFLCIVSAVICFGAGLALLAYYYSSHLLSLAKDSSKARRERSPTVDDGASEAASTGRN